MIVKNERENIERCLRSVVDYIDVWVIGDTGSTDGTQDLIRKFFASHGKPGLVSEFPFVNFEQARNEALRCAVTSEFAFDYILLTDADMELVVEDPAFGTGLTQSAYRMLQRAGISYWNTRIVKRDPAICYRGVTHEFVEVPDGRSANLSGAWFRDHASGSNRVNKFERDIELLRGGLRSEPDNHRYWYYLAQSYRDAGRLQEAAETFARRAALNGWEEEAWFAQLQHARTLLRLKDEAGFLREALVAYNRRPSRAESLYDLAKYYREKGQNDTTLIYAEMGLSIPRPAEDVLFIEDYVYDVGLKEEYAIAGYYTKHPERRIRAENYCEWIALTPHQWDGARGLARHNLGFYADKAEKFLPTIRLTQMNFDAPAPYSAGNMSLAIHDGRLYGHIRSVNYVLVSGWVDTRGNGPVNSRNFLVTLDEDLRITTSAEIVEPADLPPPAQGTYLGFEDARIFSWRGRLWSLMTTRHFEADEAWRMMLAALEPGDGGWRMTDWRVLPNHQQHEKNWMPVVQGDHLRLIHKLDPLRILDEAGQVISESPSAVVATEFSGGTNLLAFDGGWLCLTHEFMVADRKRRYSHRFVWFDAELRLRRLSRRFYFRHPDVEFAIGLVIHPRRGTLLISFGLNDVEAWIAEVAPAELRPALLPVEIYRMGAAPPAAEPETAASLAPVPSNAAPGIRSFDLFDTLIARRDPDPTAVFRIVEQRAGHPGFADKRARAEAQIFAAPYTLDDIYARLISAFGMTESEADQLKAMEIAVEEASVFPIAEHMSQVGARDVVVSDMYLPYAVLNRMLRQACPVPPAQLIVSSHGKRSGRVWQELLAQGPIIEHLGDNAITDQESPEAAGIKARLTSIAQRTAIETELADQGFAPLANLVREARLATWSADPTMRQAQRLQIEVNFPLLFLTNLYLLKLAREKAWDHILFSARDCFLWSRLYDEVRRHLPAAPTSVYFYTGRVTRAHPSPDYLAYFTRLRTGKRNVLVDLCGTGWSSTRLLERSPEPATELFLLHELTLPKVVQWYSEHGALTRPIVVHSIVRRGPEGGDNDALEDLNRAPHEAVEDVRRQGEGFAPVFATLAYGAEAGALIRTHHAAFDQCCRLIDQIPPAALGAMLDQIGTEVIARAYGRMSGLLDHLLPLLTHKRREEPAVWQQLRERANAQPSTPEPAAEPADEEPHMLFTRALALRDAEAYVDAAALFLRRADAGGDAEEAWCARWQAARALFKSGDEAGFLAQAEAAAAERPHRAEPLHDLARFHREHGRRELALEYCQRGLALAFPPPGDSLLVDRGICTIGLLSELSIAGWYSPDPAIRRQASDTCEWLSLAPYDGMDWRWLARHNGTLYATQAAELFPSLRLHQPEFVAPAGWHPTNPSIVRYGRGYLMAVKLVNYVINDTGHLDTQGRGPLVVWSIVVEFDDKLRALRDGRVVEPSDTPPVVGTNYFGFEDLRLSVTDGALWATSTVSQFGGGVRVFRTRLELRDDGDYHMVDWSFLPSHQEVEKNWMPLAAGHAAAYVHSHGPLRLLDAAGAILQDIPSPIASDGFRGGSQYLPFNGGWLGVIHESAAFGTHANRHYTHRFVWLDAEMRLRGVSRRFHFGLHRVEFVAGLAPTASGDGFVISFGVKDNETWLATVSAEDVWQALQDASTFSETVGQVHKLSSSLPVTRTTPKALEDCALALNVDALRTNSLDPETFEWIIAGQFAGPGSLAQVNRTVATTLEEQFPGRVRIISRGVPLEEAPGNVRTQLQEMAGRRPQGGLQVLIRQDWPFRPPPIYADLRLAFLFWEETLLPPPDVAVFNAYYDAILTPSTFVKNALERSGIRCPIYNIGYALDLSAFTALASEAQPTHCNRPYTFLHNSSCLPRKGVDVLIGAFQAAFRKADRVRLIIKGFDDQYGRPQIERITQISRNDPEAPEMHFIGADFDFAALTQLYRDADCVVLPTRGEGFNLPAAEALAAGKHLIVTGYGGHMDFLNEDNARLLKYRIEPATSALSCAGSEWAEPDFDDLVIALRESREQCSKDTTEVHRFVSKGFVNQRLFWISRLLDAIEQIHRDCLYVPSLLTCMCPAY